MHPVSLTQSYFPAQTDDAVRETTVPGILHAAAHQFGDGEALVEAMADGETGRRWSYNALLSEAEKLGHALASRFEPGERVAIWAPNIPEWAIFEFAAGMAGLTLVTVNPAYQPKELHYVLSQSRSAGLFLTREHRGNPMAEIARKVVGELPAIRHVADLEDADAMRAKGERRGGLPDVNPDAAAQIQYTSGTTGFPKGAMLHHRGLTNNARFAVAALGARAGDGFLNPMPMFHTAGCATITLGCVQTGARHILLRQFDGNAMLTLMEREKVAISGGVPTMLVAMLEAQKRQPRDLSALRAMMSGGAMVPPEIARRVIDAFCADFQIVFGQTEASPLLTHIRSEDVVADRLETVGRPSPQTEISIRDATTNEVVPTGAQGEICARGYGVMLGYNDNPEATAKTIDAQGWLHTGDLGTMDARGYVRITGRVKDMIIRGGENLFPAEIENVLLQHPAIAEVAVVGVPDHHWGEIAVCFFRPASGAPPPREELVAHVRRHLAAPKTPAQWIVVDGFPLTGSGKIQKFVLRERFIAGEFSGRV